MRFADRMITCGTFTPEIESRDRLSIGTELQSIRELATHDMESARYTYQQLNSQMKLGGFAPLEAEEYLSLGKHLGFRGKKYKF